MKLKQKIFMIIFAIILLTFSVYSVIAILQNKSLLEQDFTKRIAFTTELVLKINKLPIWNFSYNDLSQNIFTVMNLEQTLSLMLIEFPDKTFIAGLREGDIHVFTDEMISKADLLKKFENVNSIEESVSSIDYNETYLATLHLYFDNSHVTQSIRKAVIDFTLQFFFLALVLFIVINFSIQRIIVDRLLLFKEISNNSHKQVVTIQQELSKNLNNYDLLNDAFVHKNLYMDKALISNKDEIGELYDSFVTLIETINMQLITIIAHSKNLEEKVKERTKELNQTYQRMLASAHKAGMAEIAASTLHNIGNAINSLLTSMDKMYSNKNDLITFLQAYNKIANLLKLNQADLNSFVHNDPKGKQLIPVFEKTNSEMDYIIHDNQNLFEKSVNTLNHIIEIINLQNSYAQGAHTLLETVSVKKLINDALSILSESFDKRDIVIDTKILNDEKLRLPKNDLLQIFINILKNSIESIQTASENVSEKTIKITVRKVFNQIIIKFRDSGQGFDKEIKNQLFQFKFSTKERGSGFGLHYTANIINNMGGRIIAHSRGINKGASFIIIIPINTQNSLL
ncbi:MAG: HAMP domain-containing sensor histidine kinase [Candidatus Cloacimonetes bacterium]|nr:HAMP domain-containing sensor histidine kinase [Candidatus Cloacimonadota bacterium]